MPAHRVHIIRLLKSYDTEGNMLRSRRLLNNILEPFLSLRSMRSSNLSKSCFLRTGASSNLPYGLHGHSAGFQWNLCLHNNACTYLYTPFFVCVEGIYTRSLILSAGNYFYCKLVVTVLYWIVPIITAFHGECYYQREETPDQGVFLLALFQRGPQVSSDPVASFIR